MAACAPRNFTNTDKRPQLTAAQETLAWDVAAYRQLPLLDSLRKIHDDPEQIDSKHPLYVQLATRVATIRKSRSANLSQYGPPQTPGLCVESSAVPPGYPTIASWPGKATSRTVNAFAAPLAAAPAAPQQPPSWWINGRIDSSHFHWLDPGAASLVQYRERDDCKGLGLECAAPFVPVGSLLCQCTSAYFAEATTGPEQQPWRTALRDQYSLSNLLPNTEACHPIFAINTGQGVNCVVYQYNMCLHLYAGQDLRKGDELLINYGHDPEMQPYLTPNTRQIIKDQHEQCQNSIHLVGSFLQIKCGSQIEIAATSVIGGQHVKLHGCPCSDCKGRNKRTRHR